MNLKLKSFIAIVDLVACSLEKMLSDKIKIQIIFFLKRYQIFAPTQFTLQVIVLSLYTNFACTYKHGENFKQE